MFSHTSPVEAEGILVQVLLEVGGPRSAMVGSPEPSLEVAYDLVDPREKLAGPFRGSLNSGHMTHTQSVPVRIPIEGHGICSNLAVSGDVGRDKLPDKAPGERRQVLYSDAPSMVASILYRNYNDFLRFCPSAKAAFLAAADIGIVQFNNPIQGLSVRIHGGPAQAPAHVECAPIGPNPQLALELESGNTRSQSAHKIGCPEPMAQRQVASVEDSSGRDRSPLTATPAPPEVKAHPPRLIVATTRADKSGRPADGSQVFQACALRGESALEFPQSAGKHGVPCGRDFSSHVSRLSL